MPVQVDPLAADLDGPPKLGLPQVSKLSGPTMPVTPLSWTSW